MEKGRKLLGDLNLHALLVTRSEKGMVLFQRDTEPYVQATQASEVYDVTGAGDTVIATVAAALAAGSDLIQATQIANLAAGLVVRKLGTATTSVKEIQSEMLKHAPLKRGVTDEESLLELIKKAKAADEKILMTNGCFDLLHAGHAAYLSTAAGLGDRLIVAVNSDESVKQLKGPDRPINNLMQRMAVLSALESVDWVVPFSEKTPARLIGQCLPIYWLRAEIIVLKILLEERLLSKRLKRRYSVAFFQIKCHLGVCFSKSLLHFGVHGIIN
jgi:D-beta-D-heptose 7-phosphate kinase/D-beta-D-heptose 1-phosphate adenosyltransferase